MCCPHSPTPTPQVELEREFEEYESWSLQADAQHKYEDVEDGLRELASICDGGGFQIQNALKNNGVRRSM